jgi:pyruvate kinase
MQRETKIVATLGPASSSPEVLEKMMLAGVDVVRLNFSHGTAQDHINRAALVRETAARVGKQIAIMADLQGPKIRVGKFEHGKVNLVVGAEFILDVNCLLGNQERVGLDYKALPHDVRNGDLLLLSDGLIQLRVVRVQGLEIYTTVIVGGELSNNKGINRAGGGLTAPALPAKDMDDIKTACQIGVEYLAVSFPKSGADMITARNVMLACGGNALLIAKIERAEAIATPEALNDILIASDGIMVARGDLAVEIGNAAVPAVQKRMIKQARAANKLVITATQMMESMINSPMPTRAEVSDVANAVLDGTDAVMLSAESATGLYPVETVTTMAQVCIEAERSTVYELDRDFLNQTFTRIDQSIAMAALFTAYHLNVKAIVSLTQSGSTALWMSRHDGNVPIYAITPEQSAANKMALYRNVQSLTMPMILDRDAALREVEQLLLDRGLLQHGDTFVFTNGEPMGKTGGTNNMQIVRLGEHLL